MMTATAEQAEQDSRRNYGTHPNADCPAGGLKGVFKVSPETLRETSEYFRNTRRCPRTTTLVACNESRTWYHFIPVRCKCWTCEHCCRINAWQLEQKLAKGQPSTFITLTCKPSQTETPKEAHDRCRPKIAQMFAKLRQEFGKIEYACILETHKNGFPHWHILARCSYLPHGRIKELWEKMTGNSIVAIEKIRHQRSMGKYLVKYCGKEMLQPKLNRLGRVISFSRNFLSPTRATLPEVKVTWMKWPSPIEDVMMKHAHCFSHIEVYPSGELVGTAETIETRPAHEIALLKWLNEYRPPLE